MAGQTEQVLSAILDSIDVGRLNPGDLIEEAALMKAHNVSRTPVREALLQLETAGLIQRLPRKGAVLFKPTLEEFLSILEVNRRLEGMAAGLAARRLTPSNAVEIEAATRACENHAAKHGDDGPDAYYGLNLRFHGAVAASSGNPYLLEMIKTHGRKLLAYYRVAYRHPGAIAHSASEHRQLADLIAGRKADEAEALMTQHVGFDTVTVMDLLAAQG